MTMIKTIIYSKRVPSHPSIREYLVVYSDYTIGFIALIPREE